MKKHELGRKPYKCDQCAKAFSRRSPYLRHIKDHSVVGENILCAVCGETFQTIHKMKEHRKNDHISKKQGRKTKLCLMSFPIWYVMNVEKCLIRNLLTNTIFRVSIVGKL